MQAVAPSRAMGKLRRVWRLQCVPDPTHFAGLLVVSGKEGKGDRDRYWGHCRNFLTDPFFHRPTTTGKQGLAPHADNHDVFVVQQAGQRLAER